ncbi:tryptophan-rich sensory protein [Heliobacterium chlorum]|uniref:Tryptophan-rich sensory protein n=1 Tax=Heliobacterium chlorum TaxID=2698 RepID=A0ABR7T3H0_HELCL|nr:TspO/MBR family protein [Heliobacterium chlorum]MBC9784211.1 tryptophan-rich sensory protein [Heliobacterium chlorum]
MNVAINVLKLIASIIICQVASLIGAKFTIFPANIIWYAQLAKPAFNPTNDAFYPVWIVLYTLMGIALYLVWRKNLEQGEVKVALSLFSAQLLLNVLWSWIFFELQAPFYAFFEIILLATVILATVIAFYRQSELAAVLMMPYFLRVCYEAILNYYIWQMNP